MQPLSPFGLTVSPSRLDRLNRLTLEKLFLNLNHLSFILPWWWLKIVWRGHPSLAMWHCVCDKSKAVVTAWNQNTWSEQNASEGQTVNSQSCPFKCQLSWKQVQKRRIWTVAEQPGSCLTAPKDSGVPPHGATLTATILTKWGGDGPLKKETTLTFWFSALE